MTILGGNTIDIATFSRCLNSLVRANNPSLKHLVVNQCHDFSDHCAEQLALVLRVRGFSFFVCCSSLIKCTVASFSQANTALRFISLQRNDIAGFGAAALMSTLADKPDLSIDLDHCLLDAPSVVQLTNFNATHPTANGKPRIRLGASQAGDFVAQRTLMRVSPEAKAQPLTTSEWFALAVTLLLGWICYCLALPCVVFASLYESFIPESPYRRTRSEQDGMSRCELLALVFSQCSLPASFPLR